MATADEQSRAGAARIDFEMKFYVGGKWEDADLDNIEAGQPYNPAVATTLAEDVSEDETEIDVTSASGLSTGVVIIVPEVDGQVYELVKYSGITGNTLNNCVRTVVSSQEEPYTREHWSGAAVVEWVEITSIVVGGNDRDELRESIGTWTVQLDGIQYNSQLLDNDNAVLCMARWRPGAGGAFHLWTSWAVYWLGFIRDVRLDDDADRAYNWSATIQPWLQYLDNTDADAVEYGKIDIAEDASVTASSTIVDPFTESGTGEFIGSPDLTPEKTVDGDMGTLWISEPSPIASYPGSQSGAGWRINELYLRPAPGLPSGLQWIEIGYATKDGKNKDNIQNYVLCYSGTTFSLYNSSCENDPNCLTYYAAVANNYIKFPSVHVGDGEFIVITSNKPAFLERWGETGAVAVLDWRHLVVGTWSLSTAGDKLGLKFFGMGEGDDVLWGTAVNEDWYSYTPGDCYTYEAGCTWVGSNLPAMDDTNCPAGHSYHRYPDCAYQDANSVDNWELRTTAPKYNEPAPTPGASAASSAPEWIMLDMGETGITLAEAMGTDTPDYVKVSATLGLTATGRLVIDSEYIDYTGRDESNNKLTGITRGAGGTTPAAHLVDTPVWQREDGVTYKCYLVSQAGWRRKNFVGTVPSVPQEFDIYFSTLESPIDPDDEDWDDYKFDYWPQGQVIRERNYSANGQTSVCYNKTITPIRARWMLIVIHQMTDSGRAKFNEINAYTPNPSDAGDIVWSGDVVRDILVEKFGIPAANVSIDDQGTSFGPGLAITQQPYSQILNDLLDRTGCILLFGRDNVIYHRYDPRLPISTLPDVEIDWDVDNAQEITLTRPYRHMCRQLILRAYEPSLDEMYEVEYPTTALRLGTVEQVEDQIAGSLDQAIVRAQLLFRRRNGLLTGTVTPVGLGEWVAPGQRHTVTWTIDVQGTYVQGRNFIVTSVTRAWAFGNRDAPPAWSCSVELEELVF